MTAYGCLLPRYYAHIKCPAGVSCRAKADTHNTLPVCAAVSDCRRAKSIHLMKHASPNEKNLYLSFTASL